jgi:FMN-dependent NADH-azoreductase
MPHLLHIDSSVLGEQSVSRRLTARAAERWQAAHPGGTVTYREAADTAPALPAKAGIITRPGCPTPFRRLVWSRNSSPPNSPPPQSIPRWPR